jgi:hypothetical protein
LEKKTEKKKENRQEAREAEMMGEMVGGMRETAVDVGLRAMKRELGAMAREAFLVVGETEEKEKKKLEETEERLEKMNLSE